MTLKLSHAVGPSSPAVRDITMGDLLREAAEAAPGRLALVAATPALTGSGKVQKFKLRDQWSSGEWKEL